MQLLALRTLVPPEVSKAVLSRRTFHDSSSIIILPLTYVLHRRASFTKQNGLDAQKLNAKFQTLSASSSCTSGQNACVNGQFAQCVNGKFALTACAGGLTCFALPLVNSAGTRFVQLHAVIFDVVLTRFTTSITCDTQADAVARIANTGATGGLTGKRSLEA